MLEPVMYPIPKGLDWSRAAMRLVAIKVCRAALRFHVFWPDDLDLADVALSERNCVGLVFRRLRRLGVISPGTEWRRSHSLAANGRLIFVYSLQDEGKARRLLATLEGQLGEQLQLPF